MSELLDKIHEIKALARENSQPIEGLEIFCTQEEIEQMTRETGFAPKDGKLIGVKLNTNGKN